MRQIISKKIQQFLENGDRPYVKRARLIDCMARKKVLSYRKFYNQASGYSHPVFRSIVAAFVRAEGRTLNWSSAPRFRDDREICVAYGWVAEVAYNAAQLLSEYADAYQLA